MMKHIKAKVFLLGLATIPTLFYSVNLGYARHHHHGPRPGIDIPFDSAAYYSLTRISAADSAPSEFALKDLAAQGGNVIDITRLAKSILFGNDFDKLLSGKIEDLLAYQKQHGSYVSHQFDQAQIDMDEIQNLTKMSATSLQNVSLEGFHVAEDDPEGYNAPPQFDNPKKYQQMNQNYQTVVSVAQDAMAVQDHTTQATQEALNLSANAEGELQARQAGDTLTSIYASNLQQRNNLLNAALMELATTEADEIDQKAQAHAYAENAYYHPADPFNEREQKSAEDIGYQKYETKGMPDF